MNSSEKNNKRWAGGFLYNPKTHLVFLHHRDSNTIYNPNKWAFFGGNCNEGETFLEGFIREIREEISLEVEAENVIFLRENIQIETNTLRQVFYIMTEIQESELNLHEGRGFKWISVNDLPNYDLTKYTKDDLEYFISTKLNN